MRRMRATASGSFQFHAPKQRHERRHQDRSDDGGVEQDAEAEPGRHHLQVGPRPGGEGRERQEQDQGRAGDQPPGAPDPQDHRLVGGRAGVVLLPDPGQDEHLVVHREPEEEREDHQRDPERHRTGLGDPEDRVRAVALLPEEHHQPEDGRQRHQVEDHGLEWEQQRAERAHQQDVGQHRDDQQHQGEVAVDRVQEVDLRVAEAGDPDDAVGVVGDAGHVAHDLHALGVHRLPVGEHQRPRCGRRPTSPGRSARRPG